MVDFIWVGNGTEYTFLLAGSGDFIVSFKLSSGGDYVVDSTLSAGAWYIRVPANLTMKISNAEIGASVGVTNG